MGSFVTACSNSNFELLQGNVPLCRLQSCIPLRKTFSSRTTQVCSESLSVYSSQCRSLLLPDLSPSGIQHWLLVVGRLTLFSVEEANYRSCWLCRRKLPILPNDRQCLSWPCLWKTQTVPMQFLSPSPCSASSHTWIRQCSLEQQS